MRQFLIGLIAMLLGLPMVIAPARADIPINERVSLDGSLRVRGLLDERDFNTDSPTAYYATIRTMIGFKIQATDDVLFRAKLKDSRYSGSSTVPRGRFPTPASQNSSYVAMQEAYMYATEVFNSELDFQIGRFEMAYGRGRLIGSNDWFVEGPNAYDGFRFVYRRPGTRVDFFHTITYDASFGTDFLRYREPYTYNGSSIYRFSKPTGYSYLKRYLFGVSASLMDGMIQPMLYVDWDTQGLGFDFSPATYGPLETSTEDQYWVTPAVYGQYRFEDVGAGYLEVEGDAALQFGQVLFGSPEAWPQFGYLLAAEGKYHFDESGQTWLGLGFDATGVGQGDTETADEQVRYFYQFYYSQHPFRGYMDYFWNVPNGLLDVFINGSFSPVEWAMLRADIHNFNYMVNQGRFQPDGSVVNLRQLGQEVDLLATFQVKESFSIDAGFNVFVPTEEFATRMNNKSADWGLFGYLVFTTMF